MSGSYIFDPNVCTAPCHEQLNTTIEKKQRENAADKDCSFLGGRLNSLEHAAKED